MINKCLTVWIAQLKASLPSVLYLHYSGVEQGKN